MRDGETVGDFIATDETGADVSLYGLLGTGPVVLFFYPKARTPL